MLEKIKTKANKALHFWWGQGIAYDTPALGFYLLISLAPLALGLAAISGIVFSDYLTPENVGEAIAGRFPDAVSDKIISLAGSVRNKPSAILGSIALMLWTSSGALGIIDRVMLRTMKDEGYGMVLGRVRMIGFGALFAALLTLGLAGATLLNTELPISDTGNLLLGATALYLGCMLLYRFLPKPGTDWRGAALGAVPASLSLFFCPYAVAFYASLGRLSFGGIFALVAILIFSCYLMATGLLFGAGVATRKTAKQTQH